MLSQEKIKERIKELKEIKDSLIDDKKYGKLTCAQIEMADDKIERVDCEISILNYVLTGIKNEHMITNSLIGG